jgi:CSLREA domain-containing protein
MRFPRREPAPLRRALLTFSLLLAACAAAASVFPDSLSARARAASTFVVDSTSDGSDSNTSDGLCADAAGMCTLRAAIEQANAAPGPHTVNFRIGTGAQTIAVGSALPNVTDTLTIDATTQPGFQGSPLVVLGGGGLDADGLSMRAGVVRGLVINGFKLAAIRIDGAGSVVAGNYIGTDAVGNAAVGNGTGVVAGAGVLVGGTTPAARNVISGNGTGVALFGDSAVVLGNYIGLAADGASPLPNTGDGVVVNSFVNTFGIVLSVARDVVVGGTAAGAGNVIAFNGGDGISVSPHSRDGVFHRGLSFRGNSVYSNARQAIRLGRPFDAPEANDLSDADEGPNGLQNHPLISSVAASAGGSVVRGTLDSAPGRAYALDFYANPACDPSGHGEGQALVGTLSVETDSAGRAAFEAALPALPGALPVLTATATDPDGNTSEFSPCYSGGAQASAQFKRATYEAGEARGAVTITVTRTVGGADGVATVDYATSDGTARAGLDYVAAGGTLIFAPGETAKSFSVQLVDDPADEETQSFDVTLSNPTGALTLGGHGTATVNILDNDRMPSPVIWPAQAVAEGDTETAESVFTFTLSPASEKPFTVRYSTLDGTATSPEDYAAVSGELTFAPGETVRTVGVPVRGDTLPEQSESIQMRASWPTDDGRGANAVASGQIFDDDGAPGIHFAAARYEVAEGVGHVQIKVVRRGDTSTAAAAEYTVGGFGYGVASPVSDYTSTFGRLDFAPGETEKSFTVLVNDDAYVEGDEIVTLLLDTGGPLLESATLVIGSDDAAPPTADNNPVDDPGFFVRQQYHDFLNREPDPEGLAFWKGQIEACGADAPCRQAARASVSTAFFLSIEFQTTGYQVFRAYAATYPESLNSDANQRRYELVPRGTLSEYSRLIGRDVIVGREGWEQRLRDNTLEFARRWVEGADFKAQFPADMTAAAFVDRLFANAGVAGEGSERDAGLAAFGAGGTQGRAAALLAVTNGRSVYNRQYNPAFVYMQYAGYLRRGPSDPPDAGFSGYDFWLAKLNSFSLPGEDVRDAAVAAARAARAEMSRAFVESFEYRQRFGRP